MPEIFKLKIPTVHCDSRQPQGVVIDTIVIHSMYAPFASDPTNLEQCAEWLNKCEVSSHYLIDAKGRVAILVPEELRAWHAGRSKIPGTDREGVNHFSIGIELLMKPEFGYGEKQLKSLQSLVLELVQRHPIKYILGHKHIAIDRNAESAEQVLKTTSATISEEEFIANSRNEPKTDPWNFPWDELKLFLRENFSGVNELVMPEK